MTLIKHELKQVFLSFVIWSASIAALMALCLFLFPQMKTEMNEVSDMFASMGSFSQAFGMDQLNFGTLIGFYGVECGNILGLGGVFYASILGINSICKEEKEHTAEFLYTHPLTRYQIYIYKFIAMILYILLMNIIAYVVAILCIIMIQEPIPWKDLNLLHLSFLIAHVAIGGICFGISPLIRKGNIGIGMGVALLMYCLNLIANMSDTLRWFKYMSVFSICEASSILTNSNLETNYICISLLIMMICIGLGYWIFNKKDIYA